MKQNVGKMDRIVRIMLAALIAFAGYYFNMWGLYILALVPLITAAIGVCPLYVPLKINTKKK